MKIAQLAPLVESVPPSGYGGTEVVVNLLTEELVKRGHEVTLFASGDSKTAGKLISVLPCALRGDESIPSRRWPAYNLNLLLALKERQDEFDVVHNHMGYEALPFLAELKCRSLSTNHNPVKRYNAQIYKAYKNLPYVAISDAYRRLNMPEELNYIGTVYNGIDFDSYQGNSQKRSYLLFLGRICQDKGTREAIDIAERLGLPLVIVGKVDTADRNYFKSEIEPRLRNSSITYLGEANSAKKAELYREAIATVYPIAFEEPFGLVMVESLASGCPVMAFERGSVKEILLDGKTGVIGKSIDELVARYPEIAAISANDCRDRVKQMFTKQKMAESYELLYEKLLEQ